MFCINMVYPKSSYPVKQVGSVSDLPIDRRNGIQQHTEEVNNSTLLDVNMKLTDNFKHVVSVLYITIDLRNGIQTNSE